MNLLIINKGSKIWNFFQQTKRVGSHFNHNQTAIMSWVGALLLTIIFERKSFKLSTVDA
jgi:hypothetical protein